MFQDDSALVTRGRHGDQSTVADEGAQHGCLFAIRIEWLLGRARRVHPGRVLEGLAVADQPALGGAHQAALLEPPQRRTTSRAGSPVAAVTALDVSAPSMTAAKASSRSGTASRPHRSSGRIRQIYREERHADAATTGRHVDRIHIHARLP